MLRYLNGTFWTDRTVPEWHGTAVRNRFCQFHCTRWGRRNCWELWCATSWYADMKVFCGDVRFVKYFNANKIHVFGAVTTTYTQFARFRLRLRLLPVRNRPISLWNPDQKSCASTVFWIESEHSPNVYTWRASIALERCRPVYWAGRKHSVHPPHFRSGCEQISSVLGCQWFYVVYIYIYIYIYVCVWVFVCLHCHATIFVWFVYDAGCGFFMGWYM
jgi:hypothetical protein